MESLPSSLGRALPPPEQSLQEAIPSEVAAAAAALLQMLEAWNFVLAPAGTPARPAGRWHVEVASWPLEAVAVQVDEGGVAGCVAEEAGGAAPWFEVPLRAVASAVGP